MINKKNWVLVLILLALMVPSHFVGIDKFLTIDEPWWVISGSNYYYALAHRDFENTIYDYHPAVTTTWMVTAGMVSYFQEYRVFGQGYFDVRKPKFEDFMRAHGKEAIDLVRNSRVIQTTVITLFALAAFFLLQWLVDPLVALLAIVLAMNAPFFLGHSRLLNHEGMLAVFVLVSLLGMHVYVNKDRRMIHLLISGISFGLAQLTKSSSIVVIPVVGLILLIGLFRRDEQLLSSKIWGTVKTIAIWLLTAVFVYVLLWPGMWVAPGKMFYEIYGNAFSYAFQGARLEVTGELEPASFNLTSGMATVWQYANRWLSSSTLLSWLGLIFALFLLTLKDREILPAPVKSTISYLAILAVMFVLIFSVSQGRDSSHYILSSFVCLDVIAGIGWGYFIIWLQKRWVLLDRAFVKPLLFMALIVIQLAVALPYYPYYFTYKNPLKGDSSTYGYGEGLDQAATYLAQKPDANEITVYSYAGMGPFSFFYPGKTMVFKRIDLINKEFSTIAAEMRETDYLVWYSARQNREQESIEFLPILEAVQPEKIIYINGIEYVRIYKVSDIPESVFAELNK